MLISVCEKCVIEGENCQGSEDDYEAGYFKVDKCF